MITIATEALHDPGYGVGVRNLRARQGHTGSGTRPERPRQLPGTPPHEARRRPTGMVDQGSRLAIGRGRDQIPDEALDVLVPPVVVEAV